MYGCPIPKTGLPALPLQYHFPFLKPIQTPPTLSIHSAEHNWPLACSRMERTVNPGRCPTAIDLVAEGFKRQLSAGCVGNGKIVLVGFSVGVHCAQVAQILGWLGREVSSEPAPV